MGRLRSVGGRDPRLDKGFFSREMVQTLEHLGVFFPLKVPRYPGLHSCRRHRSSKGEALWTTGTLWGARLLTVQTRRLAEATGELALDTYEVVRQADVLTNIEGIHALTA